LPSIVGLPVCSLSKEFLPSIHTSRLALRLMSTETSELLTIVTLAVLPHHPQNSRCRSLRANEAFAGLPDPPSEPFETACQIQRAAAAPLSSGRVLNAMAACGAALWMALTTASNTPKRLGGKRTPAPITTQS
jgi:hypothetical protein